MSNGFIKEWKSISIVRIETIENSNRIELKGRNRIENS